jgi:hypothetical protein
MHTALWVLAATSLLGAFVSLLRPSHQPTGEARFPDEALLGADRISA